MSLKWAKALSASNTGDRQMATSLQFNHALELHIGRKKKNNEDYATFFIPEKETELQASGGLFVLADGVGGAAYGEVASKYAADLVLFEYFQNTNQEIGERLVQAFLKANQDIHQYAEESGRYTKMATTLVAASIQDNKLIIANVGDSRAYLLRGGKIKQLTRDHSVVAEMVRNGEMSEEEAQVSSIRNRLSRSIGGQREVTVDLFPPIPLEIGDRILLCSDGLSRYATAENLLGMAASGKPDEVAKRLIKFANQQGGADNISVALIEMVEKAAPAKDQHGTYAKPPKIEEWQKAETVFTPHARRGGKKKLTTKEMLIGGALVLGAAVLAVSFLMFPRNKSVPQPTAEVEPPSTIVNEEIAAMTQPLPTIMPDQALEANNNQQPPPVISPEQPTENQESQNIAEEKSRIECLYPVKSGDVTWNILTKFGLPTDVKELDFYLEENCSIAESNEYKCTEIDTDNSLENISPGQILVLFQIKNEEQDKLCRDNVELIVHITNED